VNSRVLLDSSAWIEILATGPQEKTCRNLLNKASEVIVPTIIQYEVYRKTLLSISEDRALSAIAHLNQQAVIPLTTEVALLAADLSILHKLGMADSVILAHSQIAKATLVTLDNDFSTIVGVHVVRSR
jgi:predicted nucleic acid-binding protein